MLSMKELEQKVRECTSCRLHEKRANAVLGEGNQKSKLMFIGEGPGADEDRLGRPFVGKAGQLLDKALSALELYRSRDYYICNIVKCRPENNRIPKDDEAEACLPYLRNQVAIVRPKIIVCLGATAAKYVIDRNVKISEIRGNWLERKGYFIMPTFHPAALLRDESKKKLFWQDLKKVKAKLNEISAGELK